MAEAHTNKLQRTARLASASMVAFLAVAIAYAVVIWNSIGAEMSGWGWGMLFLGGLMTTVVGVGLMFLVFYSAKHGMDR